MSKSTSKRVATLLSFDLVDQEAREHHATFLMFGVRQRQETWRQEISVANLLRRHTGETFPRRSCREFDADAFLHRLCTVHGNAGGRAFEIALRDLICHP
ncbi:MAG TPA: hypothetical protein VGQ34_09890, partial [Sphingomicrobium sp.]|nr:hypothetical protein [Sphingomicrobium sp.]